MAACGNTAKPNAETPMAAWTEAQLNSLLAVIDGPRRRLQILRPRPWYLPHPRRRFPRVQGVIRVRRWGLPKPPMSVLRLSYGGRHAGRGDQAGCRPTRWRPTSAAPTTGTS